MGSKDRPRVPAEIQPEQQPFVEGSFLDEAIGVVNMFDQANTNLAIESLGTRGQLLKEAVEMLREKLNVGEKRTILDSDQANRPL